MKKYTLRRIAAVLLAAVFAIASAGFGSGESYAGSNWYVDIESPLYGDHPGSCMVYNTKSVKFAKITSVKTSNKKIVKIDKFKSGEGTYEYQLIGQKPGKATITLKYKLPGKNKVYTKKKTVRVKSYPNMIKTLKVGGKTIKTSKSKNSFDYTANGFKGTSVKVKVIPASGWKIAYTYGYAYTKSGSSKDVKFTKSMAKGSKSVTFAKKYAELDLHVQLENKKDGSIIDYNIDLQR